MFGGGESIISQEASCIRINWVRKATGVGTCGRRRISKSEKPSVSLLADQISPYESATGTVVDRFRYPDIGIGMNCLIVVKSRGIRRSRYFSIKFGLTPSSDIVSHKFT